jgi:hypothetical protein
MTDLLLALPVRPGPAELAALVQALSTFISQSIMEWLVANAAARSLAEQGKADILAVRRMPGLMTDFFVGLAGPRPHADGPLRCSLTLNPLA